MKKQQEEQEQDGYLPTPARATEVPEERKQNNLYTGPTAGHAAAQGREYPAEATKNII